jgi:hypothetical protein
MDGRPMLGGGEKRLGPPVIKNSHGRVDESWTTNERCVPVWLLALSYIRRSCLFYTPILLPFF